VTVVRDFRLLKTLLRYSKNSALEEVTKVFCNGTRMDIR